MSSVNDGNITKEPSDGGSGGASPPFAISDTTGLQTALDGKLEDVADIAAAINCGQTAGTSTAVTAAKTGLVLSDGLLISVIWTTTNGAAPTLNVNGTGARAIKKHTQSGLATISAAQLLGNFGTIVLVYNAADASWIVVSGLVMVDADLPATSNNSTISAISTVANAAIPNATVDAKGDLIVGTANDTVGRLAVGTNGQVLTADSAEATGAKWATVSATDATKMPLAGGDFSGVLTYSATAMSLFANTSDGADNKSIIIGGGGAHSGTSRGSAIQLTGCEDALAGAAIVYIGGLEKFYVKSGSSVLLQCDSNSGGTSTNGNIFACGALTSTTASHSGALSLTGTQTSAGASIANIYKGAADLNINAATSNPLNLRFNGNTWFTFGDYGLNFFQTQNSLTSYAQIWRDSSANLNYNVTNGSVSNFTVGGNLFHSLGSTGHAFYNTQTSAGASITSMYRSSVGDLVNNVPTGAGHGWAVNGVSQATVSVAGLFFQTAHTLNTGYVGVCRLSNSLYLTAGTGNAIAALVNGNVQVHMSENGIQLPTAHTAPANNLYGFWRDSTASQTIVQGPTTGIATLYGADGAVIQAAGATNASKPGCITLKSSGKTYTNNGTWTNFYNLSEGTHNGYFEIFSNQGGGSAVYKIASTTLGTVVTTADGITFVDSGAAAAGNVAFRISGGYLQINVGTSVTASGYYHTEFHGNVR